MVGFRFGAMSFFYLLVVVKSRMGFEANWFGLIFRTWSMNPIYPLVHCGPDPHIILLSRPYYNSKPCQPQPPFPYDQTPPFLQSIRNRASHTA
ncbi:hypothetical protein BO86DRAFT_151936 [Aspergillus japonicus CBS 114.51]|uniref:Secreted protein n=1 Tax=Aspergillus japonicus CBS 114.51 TaxID=1448312 RepID=A0A8T8WUW3_ASPJA|nr:hypothetical protein BO86DRAFT_151936 [Aspergillus japonicus CBS 114.51]RAH79450.1 hypothetical protein BO86DRAFT_151936 [Aspergillus japonicus CBS 114.51]